MNNQLSTLKLQIDKLRELHASGVLGDAAFEQGKAAIERQILDAVLADPAPASLPSKPDESQRPQRKLIAGIAIAMVVAAAGGYWWTRSAALKSADPGAMAASTGAGEGGNQPHPTNYDQIAAMTDRLAARLKDQPGDAEGWAMLARSYSVLGQHPEALKAYEKAVALRKDDPMLLADYADSLAIQQDRKLAGAPMRQVERALKLDPRNVKALSLAGTDAYERNDFRAAVKFWEQAVNIGPADSPIVQQLEGSLAEARTRGGLPAPAAKETAMPKASSLGSVSGTVTLSAALKAQAQPDDTVFVFARATEGSRMPLALLRKQVKDLPLQFSLDDSMAMTPANKLSDAKQVIVGARVSKSGNAAPQPGDLSGQTGPVKLGAANLKLEISELVGK